MESGTWLPRTRALPERASRMLRADSAIRVRLRQTILK